MLLLKRGIDYSIVFDYSLPTNCNTNYRFSMDGKTQNIQISVPREVHKHVIVGAAFDYFTGSFAPHGRRVTFQNVQEVGGCHILPKNKFYYETSNFERPKLCCMRGITPKCEMSDRLV